MSRLLALDQSSKITGYAIFNDGKLEEYGKFSLDSSNIDVRLVQIREKLLNLIQEKNIDEVVFEDIQQQNNVSTFKILADVYGVVAELLQEIEMPHAAVPSTSWKSTLGIKGKDRPEQKRNAQAYVLQTYNLKPTQDECDAICIGTHYVKSKDFDWSD